MKSSTQQTSLNAIAAQKTDSVKNQHEYIATLENLLVSISNNVRQPIAHIQNLAYVNEMTTDSTVGINKKILQMKQSALMLDNKTRELSVQIYKKIIRLKEQGIS